MWNCDWKYQHQDVLKNCYERKMAGRPYGKSDPVRKIICEGCGCVFYTRIWSKKYCYYKKCGNTGYKKQLTQRRLAQPPPEQHALSQPQEVGGQQIPHSAHLF